MSKKSHPGDGSYGKGAKGDDQSGPHEPVYSKGFFPLCIIRSLKTVIHIFNREIRSRKNG